MIFMNDLVPVKAVDFDESVINALGKIYPGVYWSGNGQCKFSITAKMQNAIDWELKRFGYHDDPIRAVALALQNYGDKMFYDFAVGDELVVDNILLGATDSFDYSDQFSYKPQEA